MMLEDEDHLFHLSNNTTKKRKSSPYEKLIKKLMKCSFDDHSFINQVLKFLTKHSTEGHSRGSTTDYD